jgi:hypothetical protein
MKINCKTHTTIIFDVFRADCSIIEIILYILGRNKTGGLQNKNPASEFSNCKKAKIQRV